MDGDETAEKLEKRKADDLAKKISKRKSEANLNPSYEFESFVLGDNSAFAYNASLAIAKNPGSSYNPCLIYGDVGLGKTHLLSSIGNYILDHTPECKVMYVTAETFTNEFIESIGSQKTQQFKNKFRNVDVLLIDDIHFLQGKDSTQEELFTPSTTSMKQRSRWCSLRPPYQRIEEHHRSPFSWFEARD